MQCRSPSRIWWQERCGTQLKLCRSCHWPQALSFKPRAGGSEDTNKGLLLTGSHHHLVRKGLSRAASAQAKWLWMQKAGWQKASSLLLRQDGDGRRGGQHQGVALPAGLGPTAPQEGAEACRMACPILTSSHTPWLGSAKRAGAVKVDMKSHILLQQNLIPGDIRVLKFCKLAVQRGFANSTKSWRRLLAHYVGCGRAAPNRARHPGWPGGPRCPGSVWQGYQCAAMRRAKA